MLVMKTTNTRTYTRASKYKPEGIQVMGSEMPIEYANACRLCLEQTDVMIQMFRADNDLIPISEKIRYLLAMEIKKEDQFPSLICEYCLSQLNDSYTFKKRCLANEVKLRQFLMKWQEKNCFDENDTDYNNDEDSLILVDDVSPVLKKNECTINWEKGIPLADVITPDSESSLGCISNLVSNEEEAVQQEDNDDSDFEQDCLEVTVTEHEDEDESNSSSVSKQKERSFISNSNLAIKSKVRNDNHNSIELEDIPLKNRLEMSDKTSKDMYHCAKCKEVIHITGNPNKRCFMCSKHGCSVCDKSFLTRSMLIRHFRIHTGERPFICKECDARFSQREILQRHIAQIHSIKRPYQCKLCDKRFSMPVFLKNHIKSVHEGNNETYNCKLCPKVFRHGSGLSRHLNVHKGTCYYCKICMKKFSDGSSVKRHLKIYHCLERGVLLL